MVAWTRTRVRLLERSGNSSRRGMVATRLRVQNSAYSRLSTGDLLQKPPMRSDAADVEQHKVMTRGHLTELG